MYRLLNRLTPNDPYMGRTAPLTSKRCILYIYSTNIGTEYFKHALYSTFFSLQNAVCFIMLTCLVSVLFTFYIQGVLKLKKIIPAPKGLYNSSVVTVHMENACEQPKHVGDKQQHSHIAVIIKRAINWHYIYTTDMIFTGDFREPFQRHPGEVRSSRASWSSTLLYNRRTFVVKHVNDKSTADRTRLKCKEDTRQAILAINQLNAQNLLL